MSPTTQGQVPERVIRSIRAGFLTKNGDLIQSAAVQIAQDALDGYAQDLNADVAHFLEELIQNFDDAQYDSEIPTVNIEDHGEYLLLTTNETGMTEEHVRALCTIRRGTKIDSPNSIGEKGLGFKTVFKAANSVWIQSNGYNFRFDRTRPLGMVIPICEKFPIPLRCLTQPGTTQFLLHYRNQPRAEDVRKTLEKFDPKVLLFLRQIRRITIRISDTEKREIRRDDSEQSSGTATTLTTIDKSHKQSVQFLTGKRTIGCTPPSGDQKRQLVNTTDVAIAMPLDDNEMSKYQYAHNFLPIRLTNFNFIIQADFKLLQNRADLNQDPENFKWNQELMKGLADLFIVAVKRMNQDEGLRTKWLQLVPYPDMEDSFQYLATCIQPMLRTESLLLSSSGHYVRGENLFLVPLDYRFDATSFYFPIELSSRCALSVDYGGHLTRPLERLGVTLLPKNLFAKCFRNYVLLNNGQDFRSQSPLWHTKIAKPLISFSAFELQELPIIPLTDGQWIARRTGSNVQKVYFPGIDHNSQTRAPFAIEGLGDIFFVDAEAARDSSRRQLFFHLGVEKMDRYKVCETIKVLHGSSSPPSSERSVLISHARFLFETDRSSTSVVWVVTKDGRVQRSSETYLGFRQCSGLPLSTLLDGTPCENLVLHSAYNDAVVPQERHEWRRWLGSRVGLKTRIDIIQRTRGKIQFSEEFKHIAQSHPASTPLSLLKDRWDKLKSSIEHKSFAGFTSPDTDGFCMSELQVQTLDHGLRRLKDTILPLPELLQARTPETIFLDVPDLTDRRWLYLKALGVLCSDKGVEFKLMALCQAKNSTPSHSQVTSLYQQIADISKTSKDESMVCESFTKNEYIFIPTTRTWTSVSRCVWSSTIECIPYHVLAPIYPKCKALFQRILNISDAGFDTVLEAIGSSPPPTRNDATARLAMLRALSIEIERGGKAAIAALGNQEQCMSQQLIPTKYRDEYCFRSLKDCSNYLLVDRETHEDRFDKAVWVIDSNAKQARGIVALFEALKQPPFLDKHSEHRSSVLVKEETICSGVVKEDELFTQWIRSKIPFLNGLAVSVPGNKLDIPERLQRLSTICIKTAPSIHIRPYIDLKSRGKIYGSVRPGVIGVHRANSKSDSYAIYIEAVQNAGDTIGRQFAMVDALNTELAAYLCLSNVKTQGLLRAILRASSMNQCRELLELEDIKFEMPDSSIQTATKSSAMSADDRSHTPAEDSSSNSETSTSSSRVEHTPTIFFDKLGKLTIANDRNDKTMLKLRAKQSATAVECGGIRSSSITTLTFNDSGAGRDGENFVYKTLKTVLGDSISGDNWTSELRHLADPSLKEWQRPDRNDYADFTITDKTGLLGAWLAKRSDVQDSAKPLGDGNDLVYHIEVKSTKADVCEPFHLSNYQCAHAKRISQKETGEYYLIFRVYHLASQPQFQVIVDPWQQFVEGKLTIKGNDGMIGQIQRNGK